MPTSTRTSTKPAQPGRRGFELLIEPDGTGKFAIRLIETNGTPEHRRPIAYLPAGRFRRAEDAVLDAVTGSGKAARTLTVTRKKPVGLNEPSGVRLALALNVIHGITKPGRTRALLDGIARLSDEECLYWYAACCSGQPTDGRRTRALRIYLADD